MACNLQWYKQFSDERNSRRLDMLTDAEHRVWFHLKLYAAEQAERFIIEIDDWDMLAVEVARGDRALLEATVARLAKLRLVEYGEEEDAVRVVFTDDLDRQYEKESDKPEHVRERVRRHRSQGKGTAKRDVTPCNAATGDETPREEERREEQNRPERAGTDTVSSIETSATPAKADPAPPAAVVDDPMPAGRPYLAQFVQRVWQPLFPAAPLLPTTYSVDGARLDGLERALAPFARLPGGVEALCDELAHRIGPGGESSISGLRMQFEEMITAKNRRWHERAVRYLTGTITGIFEEVSHGQSHQQHEHGAQRRGRQGAPGADSRGRHTPDPVRTDHGAAGYGGWA